MGAETKRVKVRRRSPDVVGVSGSEMITLAPPPQADVRSLPSVYVRTEAALARRVCLAEDALAKGRLTVQAANRLLDRVAGFCDQWPWSARSTALTRGVNRLRALLAQPSYVELAIGNRRVRVSSIPVGAGPVARRPVSIRPPSSRDAAQHAPQPNSPPRVHPTPVDWGNYANAEAPQRVDSIRTPSIPPSFSFRDLFRG